MLIIIILGVIVFIIFLVVFRKLETKRQILTSFLIAILTTFLSIIVNWIKPDKIPSDYSRLNCPYIEPELSITNVDSKGYNFSFLIKNSGNLPAENVKFLFKAPGVAGIEYIPPINISLSPHGSPMEYNPSGIKSDFEDKELFSIFILMVSFDAIINGELKNYHSIFRWIISSRDMVAKIYPYSEANRQEGILNEKDISQIINNQQIVSRVLENYPGYSFEMILLLNDTLLNREQYILDLGYNLSQDRVSIFLTEEDDLCFRIIDSSSNSYEVTVKKNQNVYDFKKVLYITFEFGTKDDLSFMRIYVNGSLVEQKIYNLKIHLSLADKLMKTMHMGGDINGNNGGVFMVNTLRVFGMTQSFEQRKKWGEYSQKTFEDKWVSFNGQSPMRVNKK